MSTIVKNTFFVGDIFLPQAKPTITSDVSEIDDALMQFILDKEEECLSRCLGELYFEFKSNIDLSTDNGLVAAADEKWDWLLNGRTQYINSKGVKRAFKGIRYKSSGTEYDRSLIAYYIYYYFKRSSYINTSVTGDNIPKSKNATSISPNNKTVVAWRKFYELTVGTRPQYAFYESHHGFGIDYFKDTNVFVSLYDFIKDMNLLSENTYESFSPYRWENTNQAGI